MGSSPTMPIWRSLCHLVCNVYGCSKDKAYAILKNNKIFRITFSKSVSEHICTFLDNDYKIKKVTLKLGKILIRGKISQSKAYAIVSRKNNKILRVTLYKEMAELLCDYDSRYVAECWLLM